MQNNTIVSDDNNGSGVCQSEGGVSRELKNVIKDFHLPRN